MNCLLRQKQSLIIFTIDSSAAIKIYYYHTCLFSAIAFGHGLVPARPKLLDR